MRATRFPWQSVLIAGLMTGSILLASGLPAYSQAEIRGAQNGKLPDAIRLVFRGKPGDTYKYKKSGQSQQIQHAENAVGKQDTNGKETTEALKTLILQGPGPDQTLLLEVHSAGKKTVSMANGKTSLETEPPADALFTLTPTFQYVKAVPLEPAPAPKPAGKPGKAPEGKTPEGKAPEPAKPDPTAVLRNAYAALNRIPFPDKRLQVGDAWSGTVPQNPFDSEADRKDAPEVVYTAKLAKIERHRGVPCARIEYTLTVKGDLLTLAKSFLKGLPPETKVDGDAQMTGKVVDYYMLDRGGLLDEGARLKMTVKLKLALKNPEGGDPLTMQFDLDQTGEEQETATQFPDYDPSLIPAEATATASSHAP